jgi:hypothetical protein
MVSRNFLYGLIALVMTASPVPAKEWARKMFDRTEHDFGVVARGANAVADFEFQNIYKETIHIANVRSSCGCVSPSIVGDTLDTWETGKIHVKFNTRTYLGSKKATVTVTIDRPYLAEVQLELSGFIRQDIVFDPGQIEFGEVDSGGSAKQSVLVNYAGRDSWAIVDVETPADYLKARWRETQRQNGRVGYELQVMLTPDAPAGYLTNQLVIMTNDQQLQRVPLEVRGRVVPSVSVSPSALALGVLRPGERVTKRILVKAPKPFRVKKVYCDGDCLAFGDSQGTKTIHVIPVTFTAGDEPGDLAIDIHIDTDFGNGASACCIATATVRDPVEGT